MDIIEGPVSYRRRKKWKSRWAVLRRVNPASDVLNLVVYSDQVSAKSRLKEKAFISLESFSGLQLLNKLDKHYNIIIAITANQVVKLSFPTIEERSEWVSHLQKHFGQEQSFDGIIPHKQKIKSGEATLRFYKTFFSLTRNDNYRHIGKWSFSDLPHYGAVYGAFAFEVKEGPSGTTQMYYFSTKYGRELHQLFDGVCKGTTAATGESNYVQPSELDRGQPQRSISQPNEETAKPNLFKRAWLRVSQRKTRKKRPRSQSEPGARPRIRSDETDGPTTRQLPKQPDQENKQDKSQLTVGSGTSAMRRMTTPEGYEMMDENNPDISISSLNKTRISRTSDTSVDEPVNNLPPERGGIGEEKDDPDGYVLVDGLPEMEKILKDAEKQIEEETKRKQRLLDSEGKGFDRDIGSKVQETKNEKAENDGKSITEEMKYSKSNADESSRGSVGYDNVDVSSAVALTNGMETTNSKSPPKTPTRPKSLESNLENTVNANKNRRGMRKPPPDIVLSDDACSPENPYVNTSPVKTVDYVNIPGSNRGNNTGFRNRSKTAGNKKSSKKLNPYEKYDGNDDSIYHSVESLLPGNPAYQNIRPESNRSHSYTNLPSHAMNGQTYQNVGPPGQQAYVNVTPRKKKFLKNQNTHHLNYIQVEGTDGAPVFSSQPSFSPTTEQANSASKSSSSEYTWIDESKTRLLKETARMHSDLRKENLPKVSKKY